MHSSRSRVISEQAISHRLERLKAESWPLHLASSFPTTVTGHMNFYDRHNYVVPHFHDFWHVHFFYFYRIFDLLENHKGF